MRRMLTVAVTATMLLAFAAPGVALAAAPEEVTERSVVLFCEPMPTGDGTVQVFAEVSDHFGGFADVTYWADPATPETAPPTWITAHGEATLSADGSMLTGSADLVEFVEPPDEFEPPFGDLVGTATITASLTPIGDPEPFSFVGREGNRRLRVDGTSQELAVGGTLTLPGDRIVDLTACTAFMQVATTWFTNPNALVFGSRDRSIGCSWATDDVRVELFAFADRAATFAEIVVSDASGTYFGFTDQAALTHRSFAADWQLESWDPVTEEPVVVGSAHASADVRVAERINDRFRQGNEKFMVHGTLLSLQGTLTVETPAGIHQLSMDDLSCSGQDVRFQQIFTNPNPGGGRRLSNDAPSGAVPLAPGDTVEIQRTGGASEAPEAPCTLTDPEFGEVEVPLGRTVWYTVTGTGGELTVDTAGSSYDTVLGIYTSDGASFTQVACVDDVFGDEFFSLQAAVTFASEAGVTYWIQAGGFAGSSGTLVLSVD